MSVRSYPESEGFSVNLDNLQFDSYEFERMEQAAKSSGITSDDLELLCTWMEAKEINEETKLKLIECLIPQKGEYIPVEVCFNLTWLLKTCNISLRTKIELLKWFICAISFSPPLLEKRGRFQMLYDNFMALLKDKKMQPYAAQFIYRCTEKKNVTCSRVKYIFRLIEEYGRQPYFVLILRLYGLYYPEYYEDDLKDDVGTFDSFGVYPNLIKKVHPTYEMNLFNILGTTKETSCTGVLSESCSSKTLPSKFPSFLQLYKHHRDLEQSTNVSEILNSRFRRLFLSSRFSRKVLIMVQDKIISVLHEEDVDSLDTIEKHLELLSLPVGRSFPGITEFIESLFGSKHYFPNMAEVMCYEPICCFKKISYNLQLLREKFFVTEDIAIQCQWLNSLSKMLCYWILQCSDSVYCDGMCTETCVSSGSGLSDTSVYHIASDEISKLGSEIDFLCNFLLMHYSNPFILNQVLTHYEMVALARQLNEKNFIPCFPSYPVLQLSLFSLNPFTLDSLCRLILRIEKIHDLQAKTDDLETEEVVMFRVCCADIKKVLMRGSYKIEKPCLSQSKKARYVDVTDVFMLHKHPALLLMIKEFHGKDINEKDIDENVLMDPNKRLHFFNHLTRNGLKNVIILISRMYNLKQPNSNIPL